MRSNLDYEAEYIEGFVENIIYRNEDNGYTVFNVVYKGEEITCVGVFSYINAGEFITANGGFVKHPSYDMQFSIKSYEFKAPDDTKSVRRYLASGAIKGIGEKMAERIVKEFGDDTFRIMEEEPERLAEIKGISLTKAMDIAAQLVDKRDMRKAMMFYRTMASAWELRVKFIPDTDRKYIQLLSRILTDLQTILTASDLKQLMKLRQRPALK